MTNKEAQNIIKNDSRFRLDGDFLFFYENGKCDIYYVVIEKIDKKSFKTPIKYRNFG